MLEHVWIIPALTLASFVLTLFFGKRLPGGGWQFGVVLVGIAFVLSIVVGIQYLDEPLVHPTEETEQVTATATGEVEHEEAPAIREEVRAEREWFTFGEDHEPIKVGTVVDGFTVVMLLTVTLISLLVHVFSTNYMHGDVRFTHFFAFLGLFTTGMLLLVVASNTLQLLVGWELMGLC